jgi:putative transposase
MPRFKRLVIPGMPHHVVQRGNRRMNVFLDDQDREVFLRMLAEVSEHQGLTNLGYSLMTNHEHLVSIPQHENFLALSMRDLLGPYAAYFNRKYGFSGRLWQGRYYSAVLDEYHFWAALRYVERNPVRAGIVQRAEYYRWSSAPAHCDLCTDPLLAPLPAGASLIGDWSTWLRDGDRHSELELIRKCTKTGRPCGPEPFLGELERATGRILIPRKVGRPSKRNIVDFKDQSVSQTVDSNEAPGGSQKNQVLD